MAKKTETTTKTRGSQLDPHSGEELPPRAPPQQEVLPPRVGEEKLPALTGRGAGLPAGLDDLGDDAGKGMEGLRKEELQVPFLRILQSNSPQVENGTIPGAKAGMILNTATQELYDGEVGVEFVAAARDYNFVKYVPRDAGGGFKGILGPDDELVKFLRSKYGNFTKLPTDDGHELVETFYLFGICTPPELMPMHVAVSFASTQVKKYKQVLNLLVNITYPNAKNPAKPIKPPLWAHRWNFGTQKEQNKKGKYFGWRVRLAEASTAASFIPPADPLYQTAKSFYDMQSKGLIRPLYDDQPEDPEAGGDTDTGGDPDYGGGDENNIKM